MPWPTIASTPGRPIKWAIAKTWTILHVAKSQRARRGRWPPLIVEVEKLAEWIL